MQPNQNPISFDGQGNLLVPSVQSPNYVPGVSGWAEKKDGSAEFNNLVVQGGTVTDNTALYYNGTPAAGNLIASISAAQGTDAYGNTYFAGICVYDNSNQTFAQMLNHNIFSGRQQDTLNNVSALGYGSLSTTELGSNIPAAVLSAPTNGAYTERASVVCIPGNSGTETGSPSVLMVESSGSAPCYGRISGAMIKTTNGGSALTWQNPSLGSGWVSGPVGGSYRALQYRLDALDNLVISGTIHSNSATPSSTLFTLPAGYIPKSAERPGVTSNQGGTYAARSIEINQSTGAVVIDPVPNATNTDLYIYVSIPMGNTA